MHYKRTTIENFEAYVTYPNDYSCSKRNKSIKVNCKRRKKITHTIINKFLYNPNNIINILNMVFNIYFKFSTIKEIFHCISAFSNNEQLYTKF